VTKIAGDTLGLRTYDDILQACKKAWDFLINDPDRIRSLARPAPRRRRPISVPVATVAAVRAFLERRH
jgi:hypothetical protein